MKIIVEIIYKWIQQINFNFNFDRKYIYSHSGNTSSDQIFELMGKFGVEIIVINIHVTQQIDDLYRILNIFRRSFCNGIPVFFLVTGTDHDSLYRYFSSKMRPVNVSLNLQLGTENDETLIDTNKPKRKKQKRN